jgi:hypothetical protein
MGFWRALTDRLMLRRRAATHRPRLVRRATIHCPHTGGLVEVDAQESETGRLVLVLHCSLRRERPVACDQECLRLAEMAMSPTHTLFILPPGDDFPDEVD